MTEDPRERALVEELVQPRTALERLWGTRFTATLEREVPGSVEDASLDAIARRIADSFAIDEVGFASGVRLVASTPERVEFQVMARGQSTIGTTIPAATGTRNRVVLHRGASSTRVEVVVQVGSAWFLTLAPLAAFMVYEIGGSALYFVVGLVAAELVQWLTRGVAANGARERLRGAVRSLPTICDAVADASRRLA